MPDLNFDNYGLTTPDWKLESAISVRKPFHHGSTQQRPLVTDCQ